MSRIIASVIFCFYCVITFGQDITREIESVIKGKQATVGVAAIYGSDTVTVANDEKYPLMSVFKFHIAITVLKKMETENIPLDSMVYIEPEQMREDTYSPLYRKYPNQKIYISLRDVMEYTVSHSDNNTCNWLISFAGGMDKVDAYVKSLGIEGFNLTETEYTMQKDISKSYNNWSTPLATVELLKKVYEEKVLPEPYFLFLEQMMLNSSTGKNKIRAGIPAGIRIGHKTGSSYRKPDGVQICENDAGIIYMPDGKKCYLAVFIRDSKESDASNAKIIADIANVVYRNLQSYK